MNVAIKSAVCFAVLGCLIVSEASARANDVDIVTAKLKHDGPKTYELLSVKNNTDEPVTVSVRCGFFRGDELVATGSAPFNNVQPGETAYEETTSTQEQKVDRAECRVSGVIRGQRR